MATVHTEPYPDTGAAPAVTGPGARFGRNLAVVIGIDTYGEGIAPLRSAAADARAISDDLRNHHGFETWCLLDDEVPLARLQALVEHELPAALGPDDRLLFYYAGHGVALDGDAGPAGYLVPAGARRDEPDRFLPMHVLHDALVKLPVRHAFVILDCCFAGSFRWSTVRDVEPVATKIYRERYDRFVESAAWQVLTSASSDQMAIDRLANDRGDGAHSPFARALLDGLAGAADLTQDNLITADELAIFVREQVAPAVEGVGRTQSPQLFSLARHDSGQFVFQVPRSTLVLTAAPALTENANPYRGLQSFRERDRALFFGRSAIAQRLVAAVAGAPLTVVIGPSGCGKSSLVQAGLVPALRAESWTVLPAQRPGREPLTALRAWAEALGVEPSSSDPVAAWMAAVVARADARPTTHWLVVVDQLEELLTHRTAEPERTAFLSALAAALRAAPWLHLVVTVRSDSEPHFQDTQLAPWWSAARFAVPGLDRDELREIIEQPAIAAVLHFEPPRMVERLIDEVALVAAPLPLLSFALSELYRRCAQRWQAGIRTRVLREVDYREMGGVARALTQRATALHDQLVTQDPTYAITIRNVFTRMVAFVNGERARRRVPRDELHYDDEVEDRRVTDVLQRFHDARLISLGVEPVGDGKTSAYAEPTHDELVRGWTQVSVWLNDLDAPAGTRGLLEELGVAVRSWRTAGHAGELLWTDSRIDTLRGLVSQRRLMLNADEVRFVERSARLQRIRRRRLLGGLVTAIAVLSVAAIVAITSAIRATNNEREAQHQAAIARDEQARTARINAITDIQLRAAQARLLAREQPDQALAIAVQAWSNRPTTEDPASRDLAHRATQEVAAALANVMSVHPGLKGHLHGHTRAIETLAGASDGTLVSAAVDGQIIVWDLTARARRQVLRHPGGAVLQRAAYRPGLIVAAGPDDLVVWRAGVARTYPVPNVSQIAIHPAKDLVALGTASGVVQLLDLASGASTPLEDRGGSIQGLAFSPDGSALYDGALAHDNEIHVWDVATRHRRSLTLRGHSLGVQKLAISPDGKRIAAATEGDEVIVWGRTGALLARWEVGTTVLSVAFDLHRADRIYSVQGDGTLATWSFTGAAPSPTKAVFAGPGVTLRRGPSDPPADVRYAHRGGAYAVVYDEATDTIVTGGADGPIRLWEPELRHPLLTTLDGSAGHGILAGFRGDQILAVGDGSLRRWSPGAARWTDQPITLPASARDAVALGADAELVVAAPAWESRDHDLVAWTARDGRFVTLSNPNRLLTLTAISRDGRVVVADAPGASGGLWRWDLGTAAVVSRRQLAPAPGAEAVAFNASGSILAAALAAKSIVLWDVDGGAERARGDAQSPQDATAIAVDNTGSRVAVGRLQGDLELRDGEQPGTLRARVSQFRDPVESLVFNPAGTWLAAGDSQGHVAVLDAATQISIVELDAPADRAAAKLAFDAAGRRLLLMRGKDLAVLSTDPDKWAVIATQISGVDPASVAPGVR